MFWVLFVVVAIVVSAALFLVQRQPADRDMMGVDPNAPRLKYAQKRPLSDPEQVLYWRLVEALPECVILSQVSFPAFIKPVPEGKLAGADFKILLSRISQKRIDFLVCLRDFTVVAAVELDDGTHDQERDVKRDEILKAAGIVPIRVNVNEIPSVETLRELFTHSRNSS